MLQIEKATSVLNSLEKLLFDSSKQSSEVSIFEIFVTFVEVFPYFNKYTSAST